MKRMKKCLFFVCFALAAAPVWAGPKGIVKSFDFNNGSGVIDYDGGYVEATAIGTVDMSKMVNSVQAEMVARKTARHLAYEVLAETVGRIQIDSKTLYKNAVAEIDAMKADTHAVIRGAVIQSDTLEWVADRITKAETPMGKVTLRLYLTGEEGLGHLIDKYLPVEGGYVESERAAQKTESPKLKKSQEPTSAASESRTQEAKEKVQTSPPPPASSPDKAQEEPARQTKPVSPGQTMEDETALATAEAKVSSLIVDTREVPPGYEPAIRLKIKDEAGNLVYGPGVARASIAREGGRFFRYSENIDEAKQLFADDGEPIVVKASGTPAPGEITIPSSDAETVSEANQRDVFLREARVVVVLK